MQTILHFAQDSDTSGFFPQLARWHDRERYRMFFGTLNPMAEWLREYMESQGVECFSCDCRSRTSYPWGLLKLARFLRRKRIDILHTHLFEPSVISLWSGTLARTPLRVMTRHYSDYHTRINKHWHVRIDRMCTWLCRAVIPVSEHTAEHMIAEEKAPADKLHTVLNGIDFGRVRLSDDNAPSRLRQELGAENTPLLLTVGRMHPEKGYDYLLLAAVRLKEMFNDPFVWAIAGTGPMAEHYREEARRLGCDDVVRFLGFRRDVPDLMAAADLFVLPSLAEAFGLVLAESLYMGTPVVAARTGGIPEVVDDGVDGVLIPPADSETLATTVAVLLQDEERRRTMAGSGREKVLGKFSFHDMVRAYEAVYEQYSPSTMSVHDATGLGHHSHV